MYCSGVMGKERSGRRPMPYAPAIPHAIVPESNNAHPFRLGHGIFLSTAKMTNVKYLEVCKVGKRNVGMLVTYEDGTQVALGQWYARNTAPAASYEDIYDMYSAREKGEPASIRFCYSDPPGRVLTRIYVRYSDEEDLEMEEPVAKLSMEHSELEHSEVEHSEVEHSDTENFNTEELEMEEPETMDSETDDSETEDSETRELETDPFTDIAWNSVSLSLSPLSRIFI